MTRAERALLSDEAFHKHHMLAQDQSTIDLWERMGRTGWRDTLSMLQLRERYDVVMSEPTLITIPPMSQRH